EASISIWLQFSDDTASLLSSFSDLPFFLHLSSLAETVVVVTPGPSQCVFAQGDGGGPLLRAELLVSSCVDQSTSSNSIIEGQMDMTDTGGGRGTRKLARGSGWIRVNLDLGSLQPLGNKDKAEEEEEEEEFDFDISDMLVESDSDVYSSNFDEGGENVESENLSSSEYYNKISGSMTNRNWKKVGNGGMVSRNNLERAVLMPSQEEGTVYFSPSQEKSGEREEEDEQGARELVVGNKEVDRKLEDRKETEGEDKQKQEQVENNKEDVKEVEIVC
ncbi:LOW QUALITY PROTEIN: transmembrane protein 132D, partial [Scomber scombrus]